MIKVLQISTDTNIGGAGIWLLNYLSGYNREKISLSVVLPKNSELKPRVESLGVRIIECDSIADTSFSKEGIKNLKKIFTDEKPDVIHTHASLSARIAAKSLKIPVVNTRHCIEPPKTGLKATIYKFINNYFSTKVIAVSNAVYDNLIEDGIKRDKLVTVYNGAKPLKKLSNAESLEVRKELGWKEENFIYGIFARLEEVKNHKLFIEAAQKAYNKDNSLRFLIVGTGSLKNDLIAFRNSLEISDDIIKFIGYKQDISPYMNACDVNVLTSLREALSISLIEGMSISKPCITTDAGGTNEVVSDGVSGYVVKNNDTDALVDAMIDIRNNPEKYNKFAENSKNIAFDKFSVETMCDKIDKIYFDIKEKV